MKVYGVVGLVWMHVLAQALTPVQDRPESKYYHDLSPQTFKLPNPRRNDSYFGFSLTYDNYRKSLVISSPRYDETGKVYDCDIKRGACLPLTAVIERVNKETHTHDFWLGATVKAGPDFIVTCAPRHTDTWKSKIGTFAQCFTRDKNDVDLKTRFSITENKRSNDYIKTNTDPDGEKKVERFMDSFGWSIDVSNTNSKATHPTVIVGGPAMYTGRVMVYDNIKSTPKLLKRQKGVELPEYNLGYSVVSGHFFGKNELVYAVGSTYGREGTGSVHFFNSHRMRLSRLDKSVYEDVVGSMFGAVLCAANFHNNYLTDLLVGAPTFAGQHELNRGAVFVYLANETKRNNMDFHRIIGTSQDGSYFGSAIANVGDFNGDQIDEIVIAAPYEDGGRGAVYLYSGAEIISSEDKTKTVPWMQRIQPEGFRSFGLSLSALHDYDDNSCNELAVGAPYDDAVVLYRCMAAITVKVETQFPEVQNRTRENKTNFVYRVCFTVEYPKKPKKIIADITTRVVFTHPSAKLTNPNSGDAYVFNTSLADQDNLNCGNVGFTLPTDGNYETEISISVTSELLNDPYGRSPFEPSRVVLSDRSQLEKQESRWVAECSGDRECLPNLTLTFEDKTEVPYIIGSSETEEFSISVSNTGDIAYESFVLVRVFGATVHSSSQQCAPLKTTDEIPRLPGADNLLCTPRNPIKTNHTTWNSGAILLNMANLTNKDVSINIQALLFNHRKDLNISNTTYHIIPLKSEPNYITVKGISNIGEAVNMTRSELSTGKVMQHKYTIMNTGETQWKDAKCDIVLEKTPSITYLNIQMSDIHKSYECTEASESSETVKSTCTLPSIGKVPIELVIIIQVLSENPDEIPKEGITAKSTIHLHLDNVVKTESVATVINVNDASVPWWIILIAVLIGLFLLFIIAFILYECGFLRRKKKKNLQELRKSIRRQTMRMSAMPPADDRTKILDHVEEQNEGTQQIDNSAFCEASENTQTTETQDSDVCRKKQ